MSDVKYERVNQTPENDNDEIELSPTEIEVRNPSDLPVSGMRRNSNHIRNVDIRNFFPILGLICLYFVLSIGLTFYNRDVLREFEYPFTYVLYHLIIKLVLSGLLRTLYSYKTGKQRILLDCRTTFRKIAGIGFASGVDIGFSSWGLKLVAVSLYTMTKSTTIVFILIFAIILGLEKKSWSLLVIVIMISSGLFMFTYKATNFNALGFTFLIIASLASGIRWSFAQIIMQRSKLGLHNPIDMIYHMQPWMIAAVLPFALIFECKHIMDNFPLLAEMETSRILIVWRDVSVGALIAFLMEISEFMVLTHTSSLTLSVAGIFKEIIQIVLAVKLRNEVLSRTNDWGLLLCLGGICCHVLHKYWTLTNDLVKTDHNNYDDDDDDDSKNSLDYDKKNDMKGNNLLNNSIINHKLNIKHNNMLNGIMNSKSPSANKQTSSSIIASNVNGGLNGGHVSGQRIPLLDDSNDDFPNSDSEDSQNENQNASEVIFDILKRRDIRR